MLYILEYAQTAIGSKPKGNMSKNKDEIQLSDAELAELASKRSTEDKLRDALIHLIFVGTKKHEFDPIMCNGCRDAKELSGL